MNIEAGKLDRRVQVYDLVETPDGHGQKIKSWTLNSIRWGRVDNLRGASLTQAQQANAKFSTRVIIRGYPGFKLYPYKNRLIINADILSIVYVSDKFAGEYELEVGCEEVTGTPQERVLLNSAGKPIFNSDGASILV